MGVFLIYLFQMVGAKRANLDGKGAGEALIHVGTVKLEADPGGVRISVGSTFENFVPP